MDIGAQLRTSREAKRLSIDALARTTRVQPRILTAIEQNDVSAIPPRPFGRGFVHAYAREVGLDPEPIVRDYFSQFAPVTLETGVREAGAPATRSGASPSVSTTLIATGAVAVVALTAMLMLRQAPAAARDSAIVGTSGRNVPEAAVSRPEPLAPRAADVRLAAEGAPAASREITVVIAATGPCWVTASADGRRAVYQLLDAGDRATLKGAQNVVVRAGDAGALTWTINGRDRGVFGGPGVVRTVTVTPENAGSVR